MENMHGSAVGSAGVVVMAGPRLPQSTGGPCSFRAGLGSSARSAVRLRVALGRRQADDSGPLRRRLLVGVVSIRNSNYMGIL